MNYLAHALLSINSNDLLVGSFLGDFIKGKPDRSLPEGIKQGIILHRKIDSFTGSHPIAVNSRNRIGPQRRRFAGIITDIVYDHFLIQHWSEFSPIPTPRFTQRVYKAIQEHGTLFNGKMQALASLPILEQLFWSNKDLEGVGNTLDTIAKKLKRNNQLTNSIEEVFRFYSEFEEDFLEFFPILIRYGESVAK